MNFDLKLKDVGDRKYAYNFDYDVIHPYMLRSFKPYFLEGNALELGSHEGNFTVFLIKFFESITCVEAAKSAIDIAKSRFKKHQNIELNHSTFEDFIPSKKFQNIFLTHVLEHLEDPVSVLKKINNEWLSRGGRLFLTCPNANAISRQIASMMGIVDNVQCVTKSEKCHGHYRTYNLDLLESHVQESGLRIIHRTGIFLKLLANFQWDKILETEIISEEFLEGCFKLGQKYPDLCSSIFLLCKKE